MCTPGRRKNKVSWPRKLRRPWPGSGDGKRAGRPLAASGKNFRTAPPPWAEGKHTAQVRFCMG